MSINQYHSVERSVEEDFRQYDQFLLLKLLYFDAQINSDGYQEQEQSYRVLVLSYY